MNDHTHVSDFPLCVPFGACVRLDWLQTPFQIACHTCVSKYFSLVMVPSRC